MEAPDYGHAPVLLRECVDTLAIRQDGIYVDGTLGSGGHSLEIAKNLGIRISPPDEVGKLGTGRLIAIDRDAKAIERAKIRLAAFADKVTFVHGNFRDIGGILDGLGIEKVSGMLFDLGVSSPQLDEAERGFSYMSDAPLDMRMDEGDRLTAGIVVNEWPEAELHRLLRDYGEERYARRIAAAIAERRQIKTIETTFELVEIIKGAMPAAALREKQHPAKRSFQAVRIAVNDELAAISEMLTAAEPRLERGGRLAVISFHSLEDRIVKSFISSRGENGCTCPRDFPVCVCGFKQTLSSVTRKPVTPSEDEQKRNPRSRSAKLRAAERL